MSALRGLRFCAALAALVVLLGATDARAWDPLQKARRAAEAGQRALAEGDSAAALEAMLRAQALAPRDPQIRAGLAETYYYTGTYESAIRELEPLAFDEAPPRQRTRALYNAGNAAFRAQDLERALDLYTQALLGSDAPPPDLLHNLELTQRLLEEQPPQEQPQPGDDGEPQDQPRQQGDQEQQGEQDQQQSQDQQQEQAEQEQQQDGEQEPESEPAPQDQGEQSDDQPPPPADVADVEKMSPEEAMRLLQALDFDEEELRKSIQRRLRGDEEENEHDW
jgi:Ca-activated chloride channel homolog